MFCKPQDPPEWSEILTYFRGSELQNYFTKVLEDDLKTVIKPQYVDQIPKAVKGSVGEMIKRKAESGNEEEMIQILGELEMNDLKCVSINNHVGFLQIWLIYAIGTSRICLAESCSVLPAPRYASKMPMCTCLMNHPVIWT